MELKGTIEPTIGPYEVYEDECFNYKAAFESLHHDSGRSGDAPSCRSSAASCRTSRITCRSIRSYRNPKLGALAPIVVVNEIFAAGDANRGVQTAAFNLPNDERVVREKGAKRVMLKNVQDAKFAKTLVPISKVVLSPADQKDVVVRRVLHAHPVARADARSRAAQHHRRRPADDGAAGAEGNVQLPRRSEGRYLRRCSRIQYLIDKGVLPKSLERPLYTTFLASAFRSIRFGINEAHGRGIAIQLNYLLDQGGFVVRPDGTFAVNDAKIKEGVTALTREIMTIAGRGRLREGQGARRAPRRRAAAGARRALDHLTAVPVDIEPRFTTAAESRCSDVGILAGR